MYDTLYNAWLKEKENAELQKLPKKFYTEIAEYISRIKQDGRMLDQKSAKAKLISRELTNAKRLIQELGRLRLRKVINSSTSATPTKKEALTQEETKIFLELVPSFEKFQSFLKRTLQGRASKVKEKIERPKKMILRFVQEVPAIVGADLKAYGPFSVEDVATLPLENGKVLVSHGVAVEIETR